MLARHTYKYILENPNLSQRVFKLVKKSIQCILNRFSKELDFVTKKYH